MSQINIRNLSNENDDGAPNLVGISTFSATSYFVPPVGSTIERPQNPQTGELRFNTDTASLEYFRGNVLGWSQIEMTSPNLGNTTLAATESAKGTGARGFLMGGYESYPSLVNKIDYVTIPTLGNTTDFGDMYNPTGAGGITASKTRAVHLGGQVPAAATNIEYITISSTGNGADFGDITTATSNMSVGGDQTRGIIAGGKVQPANNYTDTIEYITIAATGIAKDFGNLTVAKSHGASATSSTRMVHASGQINPSGYTDVMDYITISTQGHAIDFGDTLIDPGAYGWTNGVVGSSIRGLFALGANDTSTYSGIEYITIATTGNAQDFGDLSETEVYKAGMSSPTRGLFAGGSDPSISDTIDYVIIQTLGSTKDFGDIAVTGRAQAPGGSNAHGGL